MTLEPSGDSEDLRTAITDEYVTWRMLRAHLPDLDPADLAAVDPSGLTRAELALVEAHLEARNRRERLLRTALPRQE